MPNAADSRAVLTENLRDMGLDSETVDLCLKLIAERRFAELEQLLKAHRQVLLDSVHTYSDRIDCLDYFTYTLRKNGGI